MSQESIYNLIAAKTIIPAKPPRYRSKYPYDLPPTGSTFGATVNTQIGVANMEGDMRWKPCRDFKRSTGSFGSPKDANSKNKPDMFLKQKKSTLPERMYNTRSNCQLFTKNICGALFFCLINFLRFCFC